MRGDHTLFTTADGHRDASGSISTPLLDDPPPVRALRAGHLGPERDPPADRAARLAAAVRAGLARPQRLRRLTRGGDMVEAIDAVMTAPPPRLDEADAAAVDKLGVVADGATSLGSERDQTFLLTGSGCEPGRRHEGVEPRRGPGHARHGSARGAAHRARRSSAGRADPLAVRAPLLTARIRPTAASRSPPATATHHVRMYDVLPGRGRIEAADLADEALLDWGETMASGGSALRASSTQRARGRCCGTSSTRPRRARCWTRSRPTPSRPRRARARSIRRRRRAGLAVAARPGRPRRPHDRQRARRRDGQITGIIDFGDMSHSALVDRPRVGARLARRSGATATNSSGRRGWSSTATSGVTPLEPIELELIVGELWAARAAVTIAITSWRVARGLEDAGFASGSTTRSPRDDSRRSSTPAGTRPRAPRRASRGALRRASAARREQVLGPALEPLTYDEPIADRRAPSGVWMTDARRTPLPRRLQQRPVRGPRATRA